MQLAMQQLQMRRLQMTMTRRTLARLCWLQSALLTARSLMPSCKQVHQGDIHCGISLQLNSRHARCKLLTAFWQPYAAHIS